LFCNTRSEIFFVKEAPILIFERKGLHDLLLEKPNPLGCTKLAVKNGIVGVISWCRIPANSQGM